MAFNPNDLINNPLLLALLGSMQQPQMGGQTNPDIYLDPSGVYRNRPIIPNMPESPLSQDQQLLANKPNILEGDYMSQQFYDEITNRVAQADAIAMQQKQAAAAAAETKRKEQFDLMKIEYQNELAAARDKDKALLDIVGKVYGNSNITNPQPIIESVTKLYSDMKGGSVLGGRTGTQESAIAMAKVDESRKTMSDEQIEAELMQDEKDPRRAAFVLAAREYIKANPRAKSIKPTSPKASTATEHPYSIYPKMGQALSQRYSGDEILTAGKDLADGMKRVYGWSDEQVIQFLELYEQFVSKPLNKTLLKPIN